MLLDITRCHCPVPGQCTRSRAEGDGRSDANQCCDMKADLATIGPEATLKARRCVGPTQARGKKAHSLGHTTSAASHLFSTDPNAVSTEVRRGDLPGAVVTLLNRPPSFWDPTGGGSRGRCSLHCRNLPDHRPVGRTEDTEAGGSTTPSPRSWTEWISSTTRRNRPKSGNRSCCGPLSEAAFGTPLIRSTGGDSPRRPSISWNSRSTSRRNGIVGALRMA